MTSFIPYCCRYSTFLCSKDFPFTGASALGCLSVQGLNLVPSPALKIMARPTAEGVLLSLLVIFIFNTKKSLPVCFITRFNFDFLSRHWCWLAPRAERAGH